MDRTSREIVVQTLKFDGPPRIPRQLWVLPWARDHHPAALEEIQHRFPDDIVHSPAFLREELRGEGDPYLPGCYVDEWGCCFENLQKGIIGEVREPLLTGWQELEKLRLPEERLSVNTCEVDAFCRATDRFVLAGCCPRPFERLQFLRGPASLYMDLIDRPPGLFNLLQRLHTFYLDELELWASTRVDALMFMDDWGSQRAMLIDPELWRELFKPLYKAYIDIAHAAGKFAFMHSDGYIMDILEDLVEIGLDAINAQIFCMDLETLAGRFAGRITFWGEMDRQHLLPEGTPGQVQEAANRMREALWRDGGLIAQCEFGPGADPTNVSRFFEALDGSCPG